LADAPTIVILSGGAGKSAINGALGSIEHALSGAR
jgi:hypothetical protein